MEGYFQVGYVRKKHGFKGDVVVRITADDPSPYDDVDAFFLENQGKAIPIFIETSRGVKADESIVRFDGIEGEAAAQALIGSVLWLPRRPASGAQRRPILLPRAAWLYRGQFRNSGRYAIDKGFGVSGPGFI